MFQLLGAPHPAVLFTQLWFDRYCEAVVLGQRVLLGAATPRELRDLRSRWLTELGRATDDYLRSPIFLEVMGRSLIAMSRTMSFVHPSRAPRKGTFL